MMYPPIIYNFRLSTMSYQNSTWTATPFTTSNHLVDSSLVVHNLMLVWLAVRSLSILMVDGEPMVVVLSLAKITQKLTDLPPTLPDGLPSPSLPLPWLADVSSKFHMLLEYQNHSHCMSKHMALVVFQVCSRKRWLIQMTHLRLFLRMIIKYIFRRNDKKGYWR